MNTLRKTVVSYGIAKSSVVSLNEVDSRVPGGEVYRLETIRRIPVAEDSVLSN